MNEWCLKRIFGASRLIVSAKSIELSKRLNIKCVILFPLIVYAVFVLIDSFISLFMVGSSFGFCMAGKE